MIIIKPFSTDIITNSSSVVYSMATSVDSLHDFIDEILKHFGTDKKSRDVFDVIVVPTYLDDIYEYLYSDSLEDVMHKYADLPELVWKNDNYQEIEKMYIDRTIELIKSGELSASDFAGEHGYYDSSYLISVKDGAETELGNMVSRLFSHEASYNG